MIISKIKEIILSMEKEFSYKDLLEKCAIQSITCKKTIIGVLDDLLNVGIIKYANLKVEPPTYKTIF